MAVEDDVAGRERTEVELRLNESRLRLALDVADTLSWEWEIGANEVAFSKDYGEYYGLPATGTRIPNDESIVAPVHPDDRGPVIQAFLAARETGRGFQMEFRGPERDGAPSWYVTRVRILEVLEGRPQRMIGVTQNITLRKRAEDSLRWSKEQLERRVRERTAELNATNTELQQQIAERKQAERLLAEREAQYRSLVTEMIDGMFVSDLDGAVRFANPAFSRIVGLERPDGALGRSIFDLLSPALREKFGGRIQHSPHDEPPSDSIIVEIHRPDGTRATVEVRSKMVSENGAVVGMRGVVRDITEWHQSEAERQRAAKALQRSEERFAKLFYASPFSIIVATYPEGRIVDANDAFLRLFGFEREEVLGRTTGELNIWVFPEERVRMVELLRRHEFARHMELKFRTKSGELRTLLMSVEIIQLDGQPNSLAMSIDITDRKRAELQVRELRDALAHANRQGTLNEIASGLAHELNQPLTAIHMDAQTALALSGKPQSRELEERLNHISEQSFRAGEIVRRMRSFIRRDASRKEPHDVHLLLQEVLNLLWDHLRHSAVTVELHLAERLPLVAVDTIQIQQVLVNVIRNAIDAMAQNGDLPRTVEIHTEAHAAEIRILISDTGCGIDPTIAANLFFPFHTTKTTGLGLGLVTCRTIMEYHGGSIEARPNPGRGTTFVITLPVAP